MARKGVPIKRILAGLAAGGAAAGVVAPIVTVVDVAVTKVAASNGQTSLLKALAEGVLEWLKSPSLQLRNQAFQLVWRVYALTYASANAIKAVCEATGTNPVLPNLFIVTAVNMIASLMKDAAIAKAQKRRQRREQREKDKSLDSAAAQGVPVRRSLSRRLSDSLNPTGETDKQFPTISFLLFIVRDILTIGAGFVLPSPMSSKLQAIGMSPGAATTSAQLICPAAVQTVTLPFHFLALDFFNFPESASGSSEERRKAALQERLKRLASNYVNLTSIRMMRGFASFGIGGVGNSTILGMLDK